MFYAASLVYISYCTKNTIICKIGLNCIYNKLKWAIIFEYIVDLEKLLNDPFRILVARKLWRSKRMNNSSIIKINRSKFSSLLGVALMLTIVVSMFALPTATAHDPAWTIPTYAYIAVAPNPVGVDEPVFLTFWIDKTPPTAAGAGGDRWTNYTVTVTCPDGSTEKLGPFTSAAESTAYTIYTPTQTGEYIFLFEFPGQVASLYNPVNGLPGSQSANIGDIYLASDATATLTVQAEPVAPIGEYPLPTSY